MIDKKLFLKERFENVDRLIICDLNVINKLFNIKPYYGLLAIVSATPRFVYNYSQCLAADTHLIARIMAVPSIFFISMTNCVNMRALK